MSTTVSYMLARAFASASQIIPELEIPGSHLPPYICSAVPAPHHAHSLYLTGQKQKMEKTRRQYRKLMQEKLYFCALLSSLSSI